MTYPNDANGDALRHRDADGDDLTRSRDIEFTVVFPNEKSANELRHKCARKVIKQRRSFPRQWKDVRGTLSL